VIETKVQLAAIRSTISQLAGIPTSKTSRGLRPAHDLLPASSRNNVMTNNRHMANYVCSSPYHLVNLFCYFHNKRECLDIFKTVLGSGYILILLSIEYILASLIETCQGKSRMRNVK